MSQRKIKPTKAEKQAKWTREQSAEFAAHLEERGMVIVSQEQVDRQNKFIQAVTQGLNVADPANAGRQIAVVWQDHLGILNDIARAVLALGLVQKEVDEVIARGDRVESELDEKLIRARTVIERVATELADKEKAAREAVNIVPVDESDVAAEQERRAAAAG